MAADLRRQLELGGVAAGVPTRVPQLMVHRAASTLRQLLDAGAAVDDARCQSLLQLVNSARHVLVPAPSAPARSTTARAVDFDVSSASMAAIMGLQNASLLTGAAMAEVAAASGRPVKLIGADPGAASHPPDLLSCKRITLLPRPAAIATEALLELVRTDDALGRRANQEALHRSSSMASKMQKLRAGQRHATVRKRRLMGENNPELPADVQDNLDAPFNGPPLINLNGTPGMNTFSSLSMHRPRRMVYASPVPLQRMSPLPAPVRAPSVETRETQQEEHATPNEDNIPSQSAFLSIPSLQDALRKRDRTFKSPKSGEKGVMNDTIGTPADVMEAFMHPQNTNYETPNDTLDNPSKIRSVLAERERILYRLLKRRQAELAAMPLGMSEQTRRKAIIEAKQLSLLDLQRVARYRVNAERKKMSSLALIEDRCVPTDHLSRLFRRRDPPIYSYTDGYPRITPFDDIPEMPARPPNIVARDALKMAQFDKSRMDAQKAQRRKEFHDRLLVHFEGFQNFVNHGRNCRARLSKGFERYFLEKARAEERKRKLERIERLRLLRSNDEKAYLDLLQNTKNERLLQLVRQTDNYLMQIGAQVEKSREHGMRDCTATQDTFVEELSEPGQVPIDAMRRRRDLYYTVTHSALEEVRQPSIMVHGTLKAYQIEGLKWMVSLYNNNLNGILADEMGLGKTIQTISLITYLVETKKNPGPYLVIVPLSTMGNWVRELDLWAPSLVKVVYHGDKNTRRNIQQTRLGNGDFNVLLTTYEFTVKDRNILSRISWQYIIIDEGHRMKNANCKLAMTLGVRYRSRNRLLLTGTPLQNNLTELWALLNFLLPTIFSSSDTFETWFKQPFESTTLDAAELEEEETLLVINRLHQVLRPFLLRRLKVDVESQLPQKVEHVVRCDMSAWQRVLYRQVRSRVGLATGANSGPAKAYNNLLMQCKKICNHPYLFYDVDAILDLPPDHLIRSSGKFFLLQHMLPKLRLCGHRTLIFSQMTAALDYLEDFLVAIGIRYMRLDGTTKSEDRQSLLNHFNAKDSPYFCFLLSTRAGGLGLNLQTADTVIIFDSDWNPMMDLQAQDRAHRIGQTKVVRVYRLISSGTVEVKILEQANRKLQVDAQVIQAGQFNNKSTEMDRHQMLKDILRQKNDDEDELGNVPDMEELNRIISRSEEEFKDFCKYDEESMENSTFKTLLTEESELPEWVLKPDIEHKTAEEKEAENLLLHGRGRRRRKLTRDLDLLTEAEWLKVMEGDLTIDEAFTRRDRRRSSPDATESSKENGDSLASKKGEGSTEKIESGDGEGSNRRDVSKRDDSEKRDASTNRDGFQKHAKRRKVERSNRKENREEHGLKRRKSGRGLEVSEQEKRSMRDDVGTEEDDERVEGMRTTVMHADNERRNGMNGRKGYGEREQDKGKHRDKTKEHKQKENNLDERCKQKNSKREARKEDVGWKHTENFARPELDESGLGQDKGAKTDGFRGAEAVANVPELRRLAVKIVGSSKASSSPKAARMSSLSRTPLCADRGRPSRKCDTAPKALGINIRSAIATTPKDPGQDGSQSASAKKRKRPEANEKVDTFKTKSVHHVEKKKRSTGRKEATVIADRVRHSKNVLCRIRISKLNKDLTCAPPPSTPRTRLHRLAKVANVPNPKAKENGILQTLKSSLSAERTISELRGSDEQMASTPKRQKALIAKVASEEQAGEYDSMVNDILHGGNGGSPVNAPATSKQRADGPAAKAAFKGCEDIPKVHAKSKGDFCGPKAPAATVAPTQPSNGASTEPAAAPSPANGPLRKSTRTRRSSRKTAPPAVSAPRMPASPALSDSEDLHDLGDSDEELVAGTDGPSRRSVVLTLRVRKEVCRRRAA